MSTETEVKERPILMSGPMVKAILDGRKTQTRRMCKGVPSDADEVFVWPSVPPMPHHSNPGLWARKRNSVDTIEDCSLDGWVRHIGRNPYGWPGDRLWVRESFDIVDDPAAHDPADGPFESLGYECPPVVKRGPNGERWVVDYAVDGGTRIMDKAGARRWKPSIHMPRWASRLTLEVTEVRVQRLQDISEEDAIAEGVETWRESWDDRTAATMFLYGTVARLKTNDGSVAQRLFYLLWESINGSGSWDANPWVWAITFKRLD